MIPNEIQAKALWDKYHLPEKKRVHVQLVAEVALGFAKYFSVNEPLLLAGCLLHDLDKNIPRLEGEQHPQTAVRVLREEGMDEVAELIKYHSVQFIDDEETAPKTWEEKLLFLSDKMVKQEVITVDQRFALWLAEADLPDDQKQMLKKVYPKVKALEQEVANFIKTDKLKA